MAHTDLLWVINLVLYLLSFPVLRLLILLSRDVLMSHKDVVLVQLSGLNTLNPFQYKSSDPIEKYNQLLRRNVAKISPWWLRKVNQRWQPLSVGYHTSYCSDQADPAPCSREHWPTCPETHVFILNDSFLLFVPNFTTKRILRDCQIQYILYWIWIPI